MSKGPLSGYRVVEFATFVAAPSAARVLADMGAEIIKVEPESGDGLRTNWNVYMMPGESDLYNPCFDTVAVNKRFIAVDLHTQEGKEIMYKLLEDAHVFITSAREKALERLGIDWKTLHAKFPKLVYGHLRGYGEHGDMKDEPGYDYTVYHARSGVGGSLYEKGGAPMVGGPAFGDLQAGLALSGGILGALVGQANTGKGDRVVVSLHSTGTYVMSLLHSASQFGKYKFPTTRLTPPNPFNNTYRCKCGKWMQFCVAAPDLGYNNFMKAIGREDLVDDPRYCNTIYMREHHHREFVEIIEEALATKTIEEWVPIFRQFDIAHSPLMESEDVLADPEMWDNEYISKVTYPTGDEAILFHSPARLDSVGTTPLVPSRGIGADTEAVLSEIGYSEEEIAALKESGVVVQHD